MLSIFTTHGSIPYTPSDGCALDQSLENYTALADEVVVMEGSGFNVGQFYYDPKLRWRAFDWPEEFSWEFIGQQFQRGYEACIGDWVIHMDLDFIFHEKDFGRIKQALKDYPNSPAVSFYKWQMILPDRYNLKSRLIIAVNKGVYGDRIKFNSGGDLCQPSLDGKELDLADLPQAGLPFYNYEHLQKTREQLEFDIERMDRAYYRLFGKNLYSRDDKTAFEGWYEMVQGRFNKPSAKLKIEDHPKVMQEVIKSLKPEQFGYNGFGMDGGYHVKGS